jgi:hypothetical protein
MICQSYQLIQCFVRIMAGFGPKEILAFDVTPNEELAKEASANHLHIFV